MLPKIYLDFQKAYMAFVENGVCCGQGCHYDDVDFVAAVPCPAGRSGTHALEGLAPGGAGVRQRQTARGCEQRLVSVGQGRALMLNLLILCRRRTRNGSD